MNSSPRPTVKLWIAFAGMCCVMVTALFVQFFRPGTGWSDWVLGVVAAGGAIWIAWIGIFKTAGLQLLWGWGCLLVVVSFLFVMHRPEVSFSPWIMLNVVCMAVCSWLLVFDRRVAACRTQLRMEEDKRERLRVED